FRSTPPPLASPLFPYTTLFRSRTFPNQQHAGGFYRTTMLVFPFFLFPIARAAKVDMPATTVAGIYMLLMGSAVWILPLFTGAPIDRKSTRLNSSHDQISYAVFC